MLGKFYFIAALLILMGVMLGGCAQPAAPEPEDPDAFRTALAAELPTLPPTFTPSTTWTLAPTNTRRATVPPTETFTLTPTLPPTETPTFTPVPTATATWTPDLRGSRPTPISRGTPIPTFPPGTANAVAGGCTGSPTAPTLLVNGGFEGATHSQGYDDMQVPDSWVAFWRLEGTPVTYDSNNTDGYRRPGMSIIPNTAPWDNPPRVLVGSQALYMSGGNKVFDGGVFQHVAVTENDVLCLTGSAHAWSAFHSDDIFHSTLNSEDDRRNMTFQLGIDPTGQSNPWSDTVIWGQEAHLYDIYQSIPGVQTLARNNSVTIFVRGSTRWRFDHNDLFFDDIRLVRISPPQP